MYDRVTGDMPVQCEDCNAKFFLRGQSDDEISSSTCPDCGSHRYRRTPTPVHEEMRMRNMPAPGENDMGGNPLQEGILADGGWKDRSKRDESFASVHSHSDMDPYPWLWDARQAQWSREAQGEFQTEGVNPPGGQTIKVRPLTEEEGGTEPYMIHNAPQSLLAQIPDLIVDGLPAQEWASSPDGYGAKQFKLVPVTLQHSDPNLLDLAKRIVEQSGMDPSFRSEVTEVATSGWPKGVLSVDEIDDQLHNALGAADVTVASPSSTGRYRENFNTVRQSYGGGELEIRHQNEAIVNAFVNWQNSGRSPEALGALREAVQAAAHQAKVAIDLGPISDAGNAIGDVAEWGGNAVADVGSAAWDAGQWAGIVPENFSAGELLDTALWATIPLGGWGLAAKGGLGALKGGGLLARSGLKGSGALAAAAGAKGAGRGASTVARAVDAGKKAMPYAGGAAVGKELTDVDAPPAGAMQQPITPMAPLLQVSKTADMDFKILEHPSSNPDIPNVHEDDPEKLDDKEINDGDKSEWQHEHGINEIGGTDTFAADLMDPHMDKLIMYYFSDESARDDPELADLYQELDSIPGFLDIGDDDPVHDEIADWIADTLIELLASDDDKLSNQRVAFGWTKMIKPLIPALKKAPFIKKLPALADDVAKPVIKPTELGSHAFPWQKPLAVKPHLPGPGAIIGEEAAGAVAPAVGEAAGGIAPTGVAALSQPGTLNKMMQGALTGIAANELIPPQMNPMNMLQPPQAKAANEFVQPSATPNPGHVPQPQENVPAPQNTCPYCGAARKEGEQNCPNCGASTLNTPMQPVARVAARPCPRCKGQGSIPRRNKEGWNRCPQCKGTRVDTGPDPDAIYAEGIDQGGKANVPFDPENPQAIPGHQLAKQANDHQGPHNKEQFAVVAELLIEEGREDEVPIMLKQPWDYAEEMARAQNKLQPPPIDESVDNQGPQPAQEQAPPGDTMPVPNMSMPGGSNRPPAPQQPMMANTDSQTPRCPQCNSGSTGLESEEGTCRCHACGHSWKEKVEKDLTAKVADYGLNIDMVVSEAAANWQVDEETARAALERDPQMIEYVDGPEEFREHMELLEATGLTTEDVDELKRERWGIGSSVTADKKIDNNYEHEELHQERNPSKQPAADRVRQRDISKEEDSSRRWKDITGKPLVVGREYEMTSKMYDIPDVVLIERIKPDALEVTFTGEYGLSHSTEIPREEMEVEGYEFKPTEELDSREKIEEPSERQPSGDEIENQPGDQTDLSEPHMKLQHVEKQEDKPHLAWLQDEAPDTVPEEWSKEAGKHYTPFEQREFIDEQGEARNREKLDLRNTHYEELDDDDFLFL